MPLQPPKNWDPLFDEGTPIRVKYKDIFDLKAFYKALHEWLLEYNWKDPDKDGDHWETYYGERVDQTGARELWIAWRMEKKPDDAPFLSYHLEFEFHCLAITNTEVVREGHKRKVNKGEMELKMWAYVEKKYEKAFDSHSILKHITDLFTKRIYRKDFEQRKKELYQEVYVLQNFMKKWFKMKRYLPYEETDVFFKSEAWPSHIKDE